MKTEHKDALIQLGAFISDRRKQMCISLATLAEHVGLSPNTIMRIEEGAFAYNIDVLFRLFESLEIKPVFVPLESIKKGAGTLPKSVVPKFILCPDELTNELYLLHSEYPAFLMQVVQKIPITLRLIDLYSDISNAELAVHPALEEAKHFIKSRFKNSNNNN